MPISARNKRSPSMTDVTVHLCRRRLTLVDRQADARGLDDDITTDRIDRGVFTQIHDPVHVA